MKSGDLVKMKFVTMASQRRVKRQLGFDPSVPGIIVEDTGNACKVIFPHTNGKIRCFLKSSLELICDNAERK